MRVICAATQACMQKYKTYRIPVGTISADEERTDSFRADWLLGWRIFRQLRSDCCSATVLCGEPGALMLCAGMKQLEASEPLRQRGGSRQESLNCPLFHPEGWMEMERVCQLELGGMTFKLTFFYYYFFTAMTWGGCGSRWFRIEGMWSWEMHYVT